MSYRYTPEDNRVLAWCNKIRAKLGKKPVRYIRKGVRCRCRECPIARTIGGVSCHVSIHGPDGWIASLPSFVLPWIGRFDRGNIPHFIKGDTHAC